MTDPAPPSAETAGPEAGGAPDAAAPRVVIFRSRLSGEAADEYRELAGRMLELARATPGFLAFKSFAAKDGERVSLVEFDGEESLAAFRDHAEHLAAQRRGRDVFYDEYRIQVLAPVRERVFRRERG